MKEFKPGIARLGMAGRRAEGLIIPNPKLKLPDQMREVRRLKR